MVHLTFSFETSMAVMAVSFALPLDAAHKLEAHRGRESVYGGVNVSNRRLCTAIDDIVDYRTGDDPVAIVPHKSGHAPAYTRDVEREEQLAAELCRGGGNEMGGDDLVHRRVGGHQQATCAQAR